MKRIILNINKPKLLTFAVVALAISLSAFTTHVEKTKDAKFGTYYWFLTDPGGHPLTTDHLVYQSGDPYHCLFLGLGEYCVAAYTDYTQDQFGYHAAGYLVVYHYYLL
jgi:hypothetical protein